MFAVVLHYSVTLQFSAYFHIYFKIAQQYEHVIHDEHHVHLKNKTVLRDWLMGIKENPFKKDESEEEED